MGKCKKCGGKVSFGKCENCDKGKGKAVKAAAEKKPVAKKGGKMSKLQQYMEGM